MTTQVPNSRTPNPLLSAGLFFLVALGYLLLSSHARPLSLVSSLPTAATRVTALLTVGIAVSVGVASWKSRARTTAFLKMAAWAISLAVLALLVLGGSVQAAVAALIVLYAGRSTTGLLLRLFGKRRQHRLASFETMLETLVGLGVLSFGLLLLLVTGTLYRLSVAALILLPIAAEWRRKPQEGLDDRGQAGEPATGSEGRGLGSIEALSMTGTAAILLLVLIQAISPEIQFDALRYHLTLPARFLGAHGYTPTPSILQSWFVSSTEMLYTVQLVLGGDTAAKLLNFAILVLLLAMVYAVTQRHASQRAAAVATLLTAASPFVAWSGGTAKPEVFAAAFCFAAFGCFCEWWRTDRRSWLATGGLCAGFAVSFKLTSVLFVAVLVGVLVGVILWPSRGRSGGKAMTLAAAGGGVVLGGAPWFLFRFALTGNPVFPFMNGWFHSPLLGNVNEPFAMATFGVGRSLGNLVSLPATLVSSTGKFAEGAPDGSCGALPLALLWAVLFLRGCKCGRLALLVSILTFAAWAVSFQYLRFLMPFFPVAALAVGAGIGGSETGGKKSGIREDLIIGLALALILGVSLSRWMGLYFQIPERVPLRVATGAETRTAYLGRIILTYDALSAVNRCPSGGGGGLLAVGDESHFLSNQAMHGLSDPAVVTLLKCEDGGELRRALRHLGVSHILINWWSAPPWTKKALLLKPEFLDENWRLEYAQNGVEVYELLSEKRERHSERRALELLEDPGFSGLEKSGAPAWTANRPDSVAEKEGARTGPTRDRVMGAGESVCQVAGIGETGRLRLYGRCEEEQKGAGLRGQLTWLAGEGRRLRTSVLVWPCEGGLQRHSMGAVAPPGAERIEVCGVVQNGTLKLKEMSLTEIE